MGRSVCGLISQFYVGNKGLSGLCVEGTMKQKVCHGAGIPSTLALWFYFWQINLIADDSVLIGSVFSSFLGGSVSYFISSQTSVSGNP